MYFLLWNISGIFVYGKGLKAQFSTGSTCIDTFAHNGKIQFAPDFKELRESNQQLGFKGIMSVILWPQNLYRRQKKEKYLLFSFFFIDIPFEPALRLEMILHKNGFNEFFSPE